METVFSGRSGHRRPVGPLGLLFNSPVALFCLAQRRKITAKPARERVPRLGGGARSLSGFAVVLLFALSL